jgi:hypothetical protein
MSPALLRRSPRVAAMRKGIVAATKKFRNCTNDGNYITKFTDKTTHRRGGIVKKTLIIKRTRIEDLIGSDEPQQEKRPDGTLITKQYRAEMDKKYIIKLTDVRTQHPGGTTDKDTITDTFAIKDVFGYDYANYKNLED